MVNDRYLFENGFLKVNLLNLTKMIEMDIDTIFSHLLEATHGLSIEEQNEVIQTFAQRLAEWHGVSQHELQCALENIDMKLEVKCWDCNEYMPNFNGNGAPICSDCDGDSEMSM